MNLSMWLFIGSGLFAAATAISNPPPDLKKLVAVAHRHGVPMPPKNARLVLAHTESWSCLGSRSTSRDPQIYSPAFLLEEKPDGSVVILRGTERLVLRKMHPQAPLWRPFSLKLVKPRLGGHVADFHRLSAFVCAVQLAARGDEVTARGIWMRLAAGDWWTDGRAFDVIPTQIQDPALLLARCTFDHLRERLLQDSAKWPDVRGRMKALFDDFPKLKNAERGDIFRDLTAALQAKPPAKDSIEALLLDWAQRPNAMRHLGLSHKGDARDPEAAMRAIVLRGFDAIPALIAMLDDRRITVHEIPAFMKSPPRIKRVGELADELLQDITGMANSQDAPEGGKAWRAWWQRARRQRERDFYAGAVFERKGQQISGVNEVPVRIVAHKFPDLLPPLCGEFSGFATPKAQAFILARALADSRLPKETRITVLSDFAQHGILEHRRHVLGVLARLDARKCATILKPLMKTFPRDSRGANRTCPEADFTYVVMQLEDDEVWSEYLRAARRSSVGLRLDMMIPMNYANVKNKNRSRRLAFLAAFLNDKAIWDSEFFLFPRIAVRDYAAMQIASILDFEEEPDEFWDAAQWRKLREKVRRKLAQEKLPALE